MPHEKIDTSVPVETESRPDPLKKFTILVAAIAGAVGTYAFSTKPDILIIVIGTVVSAWAANYVWKLIEGKD